MGDVLSVHNLSASYGGPTILKGVNFTVPTGSSVGVIGPNGSGKTTLFKALIGTAQTTAGSFTAPKQIAYVPQIDRSRHDFPVTALDVVLMGRYPAVPWWKPLGRQAKQQATAVMAQLDIDSLTDIQFGQLSGGQRQRVLVAKALVQQTDLILMDEPFSNTDPISERLIEQAIASNCKSGKVVLISTHDVQQAKQWDLVLCLNRRQLAFGPPQPTLTDAVLRSTYGGELINLGQGEAIVVTHHDHQHSHPNEGASGD